MLESTPSNEMEAPCSRSDVKNAGVGISIGLPAATGGKIVSSKRAISIVACLAGLGLALSSSNLTAQPATFSGDTIQVPVLYVGNESYRVSLQIQAGTDPLQLLVTDAQPASDTGIAEPSVFDGSAVVIPELLVEGDTYRVTLGIHSESPPVLVLQDAEPVVQRVAACVRPEPDLSQGDNDPALFDGFLVPPWEIFDGGPGIDGIPAVNIPAFNHPSAVDYLDSNDLVVGVKIGDQVRAYPHAILNWHEIVNDQFSVNGQVEPFTINFCPLTGSAMLWQGDMSATDPTFGVSGLLHNSNLILYDRDTGSLWSQMLEQSISGPLRLDIPDRVQVIETTYATWLSMYPESEIMSLATGHNRNYGVSPYGTYDTSFDLLFPANNLADNRLHRKERVLGINVGNTSKVYPIDNFEVDVSVMNETIGTMDLVVVGSSAKNFGAVYNRQLDDCTLLDFSAVQNQLPIVMTDNEGNMWDVFGNAMSGPRAGTQLEKTNSYVAYWFAWTAFFPGSTIHQ